MGAHLETPISQRNRSSFSSISTEREFHAASIVMKVIGKYGVRRDDPTSNALLKPELQVQSWKPACAAKTFSKGQGMSIYRKLSELQIDLPAAGAPAAAYVMSTQSGNIVYLSGHLPKKNGKVWVGQFGHDIATEEGKLAARAVAIDLMATLQTACDGDLTRVKRIVKLLSLVNSTGDFIEQHLVANGASELFNHVFGEAGRHARSALGVAQLPMGACLEIELIAELY